MDSYYITENPVVTLTVVVVMDVRIMPVGGECGVTCYGGDDSCGDGVGDSLGVVA